MPTRETAPIGAPCWIDLMTSDVDRARAFYSNLFGWTADEPSPEFGGYFMFLMDDVPVAGAMCGPPERAVHDVWSIYLASDGAQKTAETAAAHGGRPPEASMQVADLGTQAIIEAPDGARVGVWQPDTFHGLSALGEPNTPAWFELHTRV